ncbi:MAG: hypothetical protein HYU36_07495 [Planctomycetes bacterium]|nr:hypothetical protein [Planctomycetota bacterium]
MPVSPKESVLLILLILLVRPAAADVVQTEDGLSLGLLPDGRIEHVEIGGRRLGLNHLTSGLQIRDAHHPDVPLEFEVQQVLKNPPVFRLRISSLFLKGAIRYTPARDFIAVDFEVEDESGLERALDVSYVLPVGQPGWGWWEGLQTLQVIENGHDYGMYSVAAEAGSSGNLSLYPFCALSGPDDQGLSLAVPATHPRCSELRYQNNSVIAIFYLATSPETRRFVKKASGQLLLYRHDPVWGLRDAARRYAELASRYFESRALPKGAALYDVTAGEIDGEGREKALGVRPSSLHGFHVSTTAPSSDRIRLHQALGIPSFGSFSPIARLRYFFVYPESPAHAEDLLTRVADPVLQGEIQPYWGPRPDISKVVKLSWAKMAVGWPVLVGFQPDLPDKRAITQRELGFLLNVDPDLLDDRPEEAAFTAGQRLLAALHSTFEAHPLLAGICLHDAVRSSRPLNLNQAHFRYADFPLTYENRSRRAGILGQFSLLEFLNEMRRRFLSSDGPFRGKFIWIHGIRLEDAPLSALFLRSDLISFEVQPVISPAVLDSYDWLRAVTPSRRLLAIVGPDALQAAPAGEGGDQTVLSWLHLHTFFGIPLSLGPLWLSPEFQPVIARSGTEIRRHLTLQADLQAAGWAPVTEADCNDPAVRVERYGEWRTGVFYYTLWSARADAARVRIEADAPRLGIPRGAELKARELVAEETSKLDTRWEGDRLLLEVALPPASSRVIEIRR